MDHTMKVQSGRSNAPNRLTKALFGIYLIVLVWVLLLKLGVQFSYMESRKINLLPFREFFFFTDKFDINQVILNVLIFVPFGVYTTILFEKWGFTRKLLSFFLFSLLIESLQFILVIGAFDTTDLITNTFGGVVGVGLFTALEKAFGTKPKAQKLVNTLALIGTVVLVTFLVLLKMSMLPVRYQ